MCSSTKEASILTVGLKIMISYTFANLTKGTLSWIVFSLKIDDQNLKKSLNNISYFNDTLILVTSLKWDIYDEPLIVKLNL